MQLSPTPQAKGTCNLKAQKSAFVLVIEGDVCKPQARKMQLEKGGVGDNPLVKH